jgi:hypothetical protein
MEPSRSVLVLSAGLMRSMPKGVCFIGCYWRINPHDSHAECYSSGRQISGTMMIWKNAFSQLTVGFRILSGRAHTAFPLSIA